MGHFEVWAGIGLLVLAGPAGCGGKNTVDDVARSVGKGDDVVFKSRLTELNGGRSVLAEGVVEQFEHRLGMVQKIIDDSDTAIDVACTLFEEGDEAREKADAAKRSTAVTLHLLQMESEVGRGVVHTDTIIIACKVRELLADF